MFFLEGHPYGSTDIIKHRIVVDSNKIINIRPRRMAPFLMEGATRQTEGLLEKRLVEHSKSPFNSPILMIPIKKDHNGNTTWRMGIDYRALNEISIPDNFPMYHIQDLLDSLGGYKYFCTFYMNMGIWHIKMDERDRYSTAFSSDSAHLNLKVMPFGQLCHLLHG